MRWEPAFERSLKKKGLQISLALSSGSSTDGWRGSALLSRVVDPRDDRWTRVNRHDEQSSVCVSAAESRRLKRVAPPTESAPLVCRAGESADAVDVPTRAILSAVPLPFDKRTVMWPALDGKAEDCKTKIFNSCFSITAKTFGDACSRLGNSFRKERQAFMKETMDVERSEEKWPPGSFPRLCPHEVDSGTRGAFDTDLLAGPSAALGKHHSANHKVSKIHMQPFACKINVFSDVDMQVDEGGQAVFFQVASGQSVSPDRSAELNSSICDVKRVSAEVHDAGLCRDSSVALQYRVVRPPILNLDWSSCALHRDFASSVYFDDVPTKSHDRY